ncbi:RDD family protein [Psychrobacillus sp. FSL K6-4615]|uniref:RDD family protein n=1 Tax=Psychrobacillus sp. FSL K6-4615 TaxID=2921551 RepID=UPI0030F590D3
MFCSKCGIKLDVEDTFCFKCGAKVSAPIVGEVQSEVAASFDGKISHNQVRSTRVGNLYSQCSELSYAGFWQRMGATIIDLVLWIAFSFSIALLLPIDEEFLTITGLFISWMYYALLDSSSWQGTIGKKVMGISVCDLDGERISFVRATFRYFFHIFSALILYIGFFMVIFTQKKQALHDMMTSCVIVKK